MADVPQPVVVRFVVPLVFALLLLGIAWNLKEPCVDNPWGGEEYRQRCYTDVMPFYGGKGLDQGDVPYIDRDVEYPPLSGMWMYASALASDSPRGFFIAHAVTASLLALGAVAVLSWGTGERSLWLAAAPALALYAFHNWDLLAVALAAAGLVAAKKDRPWLAGILLGLGAAAKIYPGFLLAGLFFHALGHERPKALKLAVGGGAAFALPHVPFLVLAPDGILSAYTFHLGRGPTFESHWRYLYEMGFPDHTATLLMALGLVTVWALAWTGRIKPLHAAGASLLVFVIGNEVFSVQYALWIAGILPLLDIDWRAKVAFLLADIWVFDRLFDFFHQISLSGSADDGQLMLASLVRMAALGVLLWLTLRQPTTIGPQPVAAPGDSAPA